MKWLWISGWAVPPAWLARQAQLAWPADEHVAVTPSDAQQALSTMAFDALGGYSLGALWLLQHAQQVPAETPVVLLAPIFSFTAEAGLGGRIPRKQLRAQRRRLRQDGPDAIVDFLTRIGVAPDHFPTLAADLTPARLSELDTELRWLEEWQSTPPPPPAWSGCVGDEDPLLDNAVLLAHWPTLRVVAGAGHAPEKLLQALAITNPPDFPPRPNLSDSQNHVVPNFDRAALRYDTHAATQSALAAELAQWITPEERHGQAIEFGAGTGLFTQHMHPWYGPYIATDPAPQMVARGRLRCPTTTWQEARADSPQIAEPTNWIFACNLLQWLPAPETTLRDWRRQLAPGGRIAAAIFVHGTLAELQSVLPDAPTLPWKSAEAWQSCITHAGFRIERAETWERIDTHPSARVVLRALHAMGLAPQRAVGVGSLRNALRNYDQRFATPAGVRVTWRALLIRAIVD
ncbi:MAG: methyltransferase domain-containing protein [Verrucomicrobia bacterium]|nr:methyltransferase domain-containing protein [Verrucomicrobiota bacterium]